MPNDLGIEGPVISASSTAQALPLACIALASIDVTSDLPTPPLPLTMPITFLTLLKGPQGILKSSFFDEQPPADAQLEQLPLHASLIAISPI
jgi:hypothetical protein